MTLGNYLNSLSVSLSSLSIWSVQLISCRSTKLAILPCDRREGIVNELTKLVIPVPDGEN